MTRLLASAEIVISSHDALAFLFDAQGAEYVPKPITATIEFTVSGQQGHQYYQEICPRVVTRGLLGAYSVCNGCIWTHSGTYSSYLNYIEIRMDDSDGQAHNHRENLD